MEFKRDGTVVVPPALMTGGPGVFAGGDIVPAAERTVTVGVGHGKKAASFIDAYLRAGQEAADAAVATRIAEDERRRIARCTPSR